MSSAPEANELANRLDRVLPPHSQAVQDHTAGQDLLVDAAVRLARGPHPALADGIVSRIESQVLARAVLVSAPRYPLRRRVTVVARWAVAACLVLVIVAVSTATASASSLPGERLYPVKRLVEQGRLALSGDSGEVDLRLKFVGRRLDEFEALLDQGTIDVDPLEDALDDMHSTLRLVEAGAGSVDDAQRLVELSERHMLLAETARERVQTDPATSDQLLITVSDATEVHEKAQQLASSRGEPHTMTPPIPEVIHSFKQRRSLEKDVEAAPETRYTLTSPDPGGTAVLIPTEAPGLGPLHRDASDPQILVEVSPPPKNNEPRAPVDAPAPGSEPVPGDPAPAPDDDPAPDPEDDPTPKPPPSTDPAPRVPVDDDPPPATPPTPGGNRPW